jgi:hypothetical protein
MIVIPFSKNPATVDPPNPPLLRGGLVDRYVVPIIQNGISSILPRCCTQAVEPCATLVVER